MTVLSGNDGTLIQNFRRAADLQKAEHRTLGGGTSYQIYDKASSTLV